MAWLDIFACSDKHALSAEADPEGSITVTEKLAWHAHNFCKQGRFGDLLEAFLIFPVLQGKSTSHFFNGLSMFVQHMLPSAELHFKAFQEALTKNDAHGEGTFVRMERGGGGIDICNFVHVMLFFCTCLNLFFLQIVLLQTHKAQRVETQVLPVFEAH